MRGHSMFRPDYLNMSNEHFVFFRKVVLFLLEIYDIKEKQL